MENAPPAAARRAQGDARRDAIYRRVWTEAPLEAWGDRAARAPGQIAARCPPRKRRSCAPAPPASWCRAGMVLFDRNRNRSRRRRSPRRSPRPGWTPISVPGALPPRPDGLEAAPAHARRAAVRRGGGRLRARRRTATCTPRRCTRGRAAWPTRATATRRARYARVEAEHADHSYADDARIRAGGAGDRRGRRGDAAKLLAEVPTRYPKGDLLNEALWRLAFSAWRAGGDWTRRCAGWTRTCASSRARRSGTRRAGPVLEGARVREAAAGRRGAHLVRARRARVPAVGLRAAVAEPAQGASTRRAQKALVAALRKGMHDIPAWSFRPAPLYGEPGFLRAVELARMGQGSDARRELAQGRPGDVGRQARDRGGARRGRGSGLDQRRSCSTAAASGARRTRCPATA